MKQLILLLVFAIPYLVQAQTQKGSWLTGSNFDLSGGVGSLSISPTNTIGIGFTDSRVEDSNGNVIDETRSTTVAFSPRVAYFVIDNFAAGLEVNYVYLDISPEGTDNSFNQTIFTAGPFVRYYFDIEKFKPFLELGATFGNIKSKSDFSFGNNESNAAILDIFGGGGLAVFLNEKVSLDVLIGYRRFSLDEDSDQSQSNQLRSTFGVKLGFQILFQKS